MHRECTEGQTSEGLNGEPVLCSTGAKAAYGYDPRTGEELWRVEHDAYSASPPRPVYHDGSFIIVTGFSKGAEMMSIKAGGRGVVNDTHIEWRFDQSFPKYSSPILVDDLLYFAMDDSFLVCVEAETGETVWKGRAGGKYRACPIYADGKLYFFSLEGKTTVIEPGREFKILATNDLATDAPLDDPRRGPGFMASPAVVEDAMFLRTRYHLYRIDSRTRRLRGHSFPTTLKRPSTSTDRRPQSSSDGVTRKIMAGSQPGPGHSMVHDPARDALQSRWDKCGDDSLIP